MFWASVFPTGHRLPFGGHCLAANPFGRKLSSFFCRRMEIFVSPCFLVTFLEHICLLHTLKINWMHQMIRFEFFPYMSPNTLLFLFYGLSIGCDTIWHHQKIGTNAPWIFNPLDWKINWSAVFFLISEKSDRRAPTRLWMGPRRQDIKNPNVATFFHFQYNLSFKFHEFHGNSCIFQTLNRWHTSLQQWPLISKFDPDRNFSAADRHQRSSTAAGLYWHATDSKKKSFKSKSIFPSHIRLVNHQKTHQPPSWPHEIP